MYTRRPAILTIFVIMVYSAVPHAQTWTNADLTKPHTRAEPANPSVYASLATHQFHAVPAAPSGPRVARTLATTPSVGPWNWPVPEPRLRLDGTSLVQRPTTYRVSRAWR